MAETGDAAVGDWLYRRHVSLDAGMRRRSGTLTIRRNDVSFQSDEGQTLRLNGGFAVVHRLLGPFGMNWEVTLDHDPTINEPIVLAGGRRSMATVVGALRAAGFAVAVARRPL